MEVNFPSSKRVLLWVCGFREWFCPRRLGTISLVAPCGGMGEVLQIVACSGRPVRWAIGFRRADGVPFGWWQRFASHVLRRHVCQCGAVGKCSLPATGGAFRMEFCIPCQFAFSASLRKSEPCLFGSFAAGHGEQNQRFPTRSQEVWEGYLWMYLLVCGDGRGCIFIIRASVAGSLWGIWLFGFGVPEGDLSSVSRLLLLWAVQAGLAVCWSSGVCISQRAPLRNHVLRDGTVLPFGSAMWLELRACVGRARMFSACCVFGGDLRSGYVVLRVVCFCD